MDHREIHDGVDVNIIPKLQIAGIQFETQQLKVGDYILQNTDIGSEVCIEFKRLPDFISSVYDGRLWKELEQMEKTYSHSFIILSGKWDDIYKQEAKLKHMKIIKNKTYFSVSQRIGIFASIACRYKNVKLIQLENDNQFIDILPKLLEKSYDGKGIEYQHVIKHKSEPYIYLNILKSFPSISPTKAEKIIAAYPTWQDFNKAILEKTFELPGFGAKSLQMFEKFIIGDITKAF